MARRRSHSRKRRRNAPGRRRRGAVSHRRRRNQIVANPRRRRARGRRRNPPRLFGRGFGGGRGIVGQLTGGVVDAAWVLGGEAGTNVISGFIPLDKTGPMGLVVKLAAAVAVAWFAKRVSPNASKMALAGGLASVIRGPIKGANIPLVSVNLGDDADYAVGAYPQGLLPAGVGAYPESGYGDEEEAAFVQY